MSGSSSFSDIKSQTLDFWVGSEVAGQSPARERLLTVHSGSSYRDDLGPLRVPFETLTHC
jgi:hypothetical protein